ncbi:nucleotide sugar dehydrogenase [Planktomarina temperata]|nr:nucleotide sugar dehydrogenase [Planktomarina temperata]
MSDKKDFSLDNLKIGIVGLGYVGLPLAVELGKVYSVIGYDFNDSRIDQLRQGYDATKEIDKHELALSPNLILTSVPKNIADCNVFIVTVPTPIDQNKQPDISLLINASETIGQFLKLGDVVIYESTVYPGCTEEECVPVLEHISGLTFNEDFYVGYSPERINPGDKVHRLTTIKKITSGSTPDAARFIDNIYSSIVTAGTHLAPTIKVAEAAKVIENTQRDVNIALMNELSILFRKLGLDTTQVLEAASTKWNFLPFKPGLVGGHCIGVDPYYLTYKAQSVGYHPEMILAGRRLNDSMATYVASRLIKAMINKRINIHGSRILVMGLSFKENCPDIRNTPVAEIVKELEAYDAIVEVFDPWVDPFDAHKEYEISLLNKSPSFNGEQILDSNENSGFDAILFGVAHDAFKEMDPEVLHSIRNPNCVIFDVKSIFSSELDFERL